jgi:hypothetical protein
MFKFVFAFVLTVGFISTSQARFIVEEANSQQECKAEEKVCPVPGPSEVVPLQPGESHGNSNYCYYVAPVVQFEFGSVKFSFRYVDKVCFEHMQRLLRYAKVETEREMKYFEGRRKKYLKEREKGKSLGIEILPALKEPVMIPKVQRI